LPAEIVILLRSQKKVKTSKEWLILVKEACNAAVAAKDDVLALKFSSCWLAVAIPNLGTFPSGLRTNLGLSRGPVRRNWDACVGLLDFSIEGTSARACRRSILQALDRTPLAEDNEENLALLEKLHPEEGAVGTRAEDAVPSDVDLKKARAGPLPCLVGRHGLFEFSQEGLCWGYDGLDFRPS
jgi:hypothetical protein